MDRGYKTIEEVLNGENGRLVAGVPFGIDTLLRD